MVEDTILKILRNHQIVTVAGLEGIRHLLSESRSNVALDLPPPIRITHTGTHTHYPYVLPIRPYAHTRTHTTHPYYSPILPIRTTHTPIRVPIPRTHTTTRFTHAGQTTHPVWVTGMGNRYG